MRRRVAGSCGCWAEAAVASAQNEKTLQCRRAGRACSHSSFAARAREKSPAALLSPTTPAGRSLSTRPYAPLTRARARLATACVCSGAGETRASPYTHLRGARARIDGFLVSFLPATYTMVHVDLDSWIDKLRKAEHLEEDELKTLCEMVRRRAGGRGLRNVFSTTSPSPSPSPSFTRPHSTQHLHPAPHRSRKSWSRSPTCSPSTARSR